MEQNPPTDTSAFTPSIEPLQKMEVIKPTKNNSFLIILLSILLIIAVLFAGLFAYQTQKLAKQLTEIQNQPTPTPIASIEPSPTPDPTADWETYTNTSSNYEIKYPVDWKIEDFGLMEAKPADELTKYVRILYQQDLSKSDIGFDIEETATVNISQDIKFDETENIGKSLAKCGNTNDSITTFCWLSVPNQSKFLVFTISKYPEIESNEIVDQILSTFKFIEN